MRASATVNPLQRTTRAFLRSHRETNADACRAGVQSISQTRLHFQCIIAGFDNAPAATVGRSPADSAAAAARCVQWRTDGSPHVPDRPDDNPTITRVKTTQSGSAGKSGKGKERASGEGVAGLSGLRSPGGKGRERSTGTGGTGWSGSGGSGAKKRRRSEGGGGGGTASSGGR